MYNDRVEVKRRWRNIALATQRYNRVESSFIHVP